MKQIKCLTSLRFFAAAMIVAVASAFCQCHVNVGTREKTPVYRTIFSMAALVLTVQGAGVALSLLTDPTASENVATIARPLVGAATVYFVCNTALIATAIGLSTRQGIVRVWNENFLWSAPSYFVGALAAAAAAWVIQRGGYWTALLTSMPVYLLYRTYKVYLGRVQDEASALAAPTSEPVTRRRRSMFRIFPSLRGYKQRGAGQAKPKPPPPRVVSSRLAVSAQTTWTTGAITSWAIRSPRRSRPASTAIQD
jgi:hypothetical protein